MLAAPVRTLAAVIASVFVAAPALAELDAPPADEAPEEEDRDEPGRGDFDAGGQVRLPSGPDGDGEFATFNWVAVDLVGRYFLLDWATVTGNIPLAVVKPGTLMNGADPKLIGGMSVTLETTLPKLPFQPSRYETDVGILLTGAYMREGAMLLSDKDFPLFVGGFEPGFASGLAMKIELSSLVDFSLRPIYVQQGGSAGALRAVQVPTALMLALGERAVVSADLGVYTGAGFSFRGSKGGRLSTGGSLTVKIGPILAHAGAGVASLLTGGAYPTIRDSVYVDLNVKYAN
jgi:hypothetical protein